MEKHVMTMPLQEEELRKLKIGDVVYLTGHIFTSRDMGHLRLRSLAAEGKPLPKDFTGAAIFHAGPVCLKNEDGSWRLNVIGPTTSIRMEPHADFVGQLGAKAIIGKGGMDQGTLDACEKYGYVYLQAAPAALPSWPRGSSGWWTSTGLNWGCPRPCGTWKWRNLAPWWWGWTPIRTASTKT